MVIEDQTFVYISVIDKNGNRISWYFYISDRPSGCLK